MIDYVWYSRSTGKTGRALAKALGVPHYGRRIPAESYEHVLTWGARIPSIVSESNLTQLINKTKIFNNILEIERNAGDKYRSLEIMERNKVSTPKVYTHTEIQRALKDKVLSFPIIGRTKQHMGGSGFYFCKNGSELASRLCYADYFIEYIPIHSEYRIHVFYDRIIRCHKKVATPECNELIRSHKKGWIFKRIPVSSMHRALLGEARKAVKCLGLNYGAVDVIEDKDHKPYVLEVNTAPSLSDAGIKTYVRMFQTKMEELGI